MSVENLLPRVALACLLAAVAVLLWPGRGRLPRSLSHPSGGGGGTVAVAVDTLRRPASRAWARVPAVARRRAERARDAREADFLGAVDALGPALEAGLSPDVVLREAAAAGADPLVRDLLTSLRRTPAGALAEPGVPAGTGLPGSAAAPWDEPGPALLLRGWKLAHRLGAPLAATTQTVAALTRGVTEQRRAVESAVAEARATARVLQFLPLAGPGVAWAVGVPPQELLGSTLSMLCVVLGLGFWLLGSRWMTALVRSVETAGDAPLGTGGERGEGARS